MLQQMDLLDHMTQLIRTIFQESQEIKLIEDKCLLQDGLKLIGILILQIVLLLFMGVKVMLLQRNL
ncbi:MAG: hypothetical protein DI529_14160 [Chryseobacterium sp.]|nr:MAG: hypothetical protein DI529_14160 [Chryseobacterium sp.]